MSARGNERLRADCHDHRGPRPLPREAHLQHQQSALPGHVAGAALLVLVAAAGRELASGGCDPPAADREILLHASRRPVRCAPGQCPPAPGSRFGPEALAGAGAGGGAGAGVGGGGGVAVPPGAFAFAPGPGKKLHPFAQLLAEAFLDKRDVNAATLLLAALGATDRENQPLVSDASLEYPGQAMLIHEIVAPALQSVLPLAGAFGSGGAETARLRQSIEALERTVTAQQAVLDELRNR